MIDPTTQALAVQAAEEKKASFRESLPQSLEEAAAEEPRDCVAPFHLKEVSVNPEYIFFEGDLQ